MTQSLAPFKVAAFYRFVALDDLPKLQKSIQDFCVPRDIIGIILLAPEGINSTIGGAPDQLDEAIAFLDQLVGISQGELKFSTAEIKPFRRLRVRLKKEIVTIKAPEADPTKQVGTYLNPQEWNQLLQDPEVVLLDTRNVYETELGIFGGAIDPKIKIFSEFPKYVQENLDPTKHKKIAMFCTGGIRCEKASSYMLAHGFEEVYHLKGGILKYIEETPPEQSRWDGTCFVFDRRVALDHGLVENKDAQAFTAANAAWPMRD
jgi:UPF0176 protein